MFRSSVSQMVPCYGISQDPAGNYIMVMKYMEAGNLREFLKKNYRKLNFYDENEKNSKLHFLQQISQGLKDIHRKNLVHRDFHSGNIIVNRDKHDRDNCHITDLGLAKPVNEKDDNKIFGVMPYVAPEVLQNKPYTPASDIYSLGMIMYEIITGIPPFHEYAHNVNLALQICQGMRPSFSNPKTPQQQEPKNRPSAKEVNSIVGEWFEEEKIATLLQNPGRQQQAIELELKKLAKEIGKSFTDEQKELVKEFIKANRKATKNQADEVAITNAEEAEERLKKNLKETDFSREEIKKVTRHCEKLVDELVKQLEKIQLQAQVEIPTNK
ncbi:9731_t:CDS:2 [Ambispora gerdemannii]|uniref:non-specific serine/threonine protein kinase n=1 Tax=Ambispora gerdemannii TaxID=144530 RepID=A0A9N8ZRB1_9GLOM|nr:9731_t:CDS:2 [Ambispora gerdemannii]